MVPSLHRSIDSRETASLSTGEIRRSGRLHQRSFPAWLRRTSYRIFPIASLPFYFRALTTLLRPRLSSRGCVASMRSSHSSLAAPAVEDPRRLASRLSSRVVSQRTRVNLHPTRTSLNLRPARRQCVGFCWRANFASRAKELPSAGPDLRIIAEGDGRWARCDQDPRWVQREPSRPPPRASARLEGSARAESWPSPRTLARVPLRLNFAN